MKRLLLDGLRSFASIFAVILAMDFKSAGFVEPGTMVSHLTYGAVAAFVVMFVTRIYPRPRRNS